MSSITEELILESQQYDDNDNWCVSIGEYYIKCVNEKMIFKLPKEELQEVMDVFVDFLSNTRNYYINQDEEVKANENESM